MIFKWQHYPVWNVEYLYLNWTEPEVLEARGESLTESKACRGSFCRRMLTWSKRQNTYQAKRLSIIAPPRLKKIKSIKLEQLLWKLILKNSISFLGFLRHKHKHKNKNRDDASTSTKRRKMFFYIYFACACVVSVSTYFFSHACACIVRVNHPLAICLKFPPAKLSVWVELMRVFQTMIQDGELCV